MLSPIIDLFSELMRALGSIGLQGTLLMQEKGRAVRMFHLKVQDGPGEVGVSVLNLDVVTALDKRNMQELNVQVLHELPGVHPHRKAHYRHYRFQTDGMVVLVQPDHPCLTHVEQYHWPVGLADLARILAQTLRARGATKELAAASRWRDNLGKLLPIPYAA